MRRRVRLGIRPHQAANHSLVAGIAPACFAFEERERIVVQSDRDLGLPDRAAAGKIVDRRKLVSDPMQLPNDFAFVV